MSSRSSDSRLSYIDEQTNSKAVKDYIRNRGKKRPPLAEEIKRSQSTDRPLGARSDSVLTTRSLPTPATLRTVEEEKDEVMKNLSSANRKNEVERERQAELIAQRREKRMQQKKTTEEKALELLEKAVAMDKMLQDQKKEQDQKLKERLEDMKRKRAESRIGTPPVVADDTSRDKKDRQSRTEQKERKSNEDRSDKPKSDKSEKYDQKITSDKKDRREKSNNGENPDKKDRRDKTRSEEKSKEAKEREKKEADYDFTIY